MGVMRLPSRHDYWRKTRQLLVTQFGTVMSRNRFDQIWRYLHLSDNETRDATDKLYKIRWFIDFLNSRFMDVYCPYGNFVVDESMIKFKGRLQFRQYLPSKPIKVWALAESSTGYLSRCQIYTGKEGGRQENGLSHRVVMDLVRYLSGSHATIFMANFYTSVKLLQDLLAIGLHGCGTVRANPLHQCSQQLCRCQGHVSRRDAATAPDVRDVPRRRGNRVDRRLQVEGRAATPPACAAPTCHP